MTLALCAPAAAAPDILRDQFRDPPAAARPRVWWHWMNGNITKEGIRRDLDWMKQIGIGGVNAIDASINTPQVVDKRLVYMTPEWKEAFRYAARLADQRGIELSVDSSPGWSETGGPWVGPEAAMKKLVWSRTEVEGAFHGRLPQPPSVAGPFQNIARAGPSFYRDSRVVAYRMPVAEPRAPKADSNVGAVAVAALNDGDLANGADMNPPSRDAEVWVRLDYGAPVTLQGLTLALSTNEGLGFAARIEAGDDGTAWHAVADVPVAAQVRRFALLQQTIAFAPVTARFFRLVIRPAPPIPNSLRIVETAPGAIVAVPPPVPADAARFYRLYEMAFHAGATVNEFEKKAGFAIARDNYAIAARDAVTPGSAVKPAEVMDITSRMHADGNLDWDPPPGRWAVLRMGWSLIGTTNHPATPEATGLEVDKLNRGHVHDYLEHYLDTYRDAAGPDLFGHRGLTALTVDSTEVGAQNWSDTILADFRRLRGYDPLPWLPALTGAVVASPVESDRFLWDFRRTIAELLAENHYGEIARIAHERGLINYGEALEDHRPTFGDDTEMRRFADIPMAAMWTYGTRPEPLPTYVADIQGAASVAHLYGRKLVAAESLTSAGQPWAYGPRQLKPVVDMEFVLGVNRVVIHTSVHQPVEKAPGLSLGGFGQFFTRLESWAGQAKGWVSYIARCSHLLQQGRAVADVAYFYGEEAPITGLFGDAPVSDVPRGHGFDFVNADALLHLLSVDHGDLVTPSGMRYRLLYLGGSSRFMTLPVLRRVRELVTSGAMVVGQRPDSSPSLADDPAQFQTLADEVFGRNEQERSPGQGRVFPSLADAFTALKLPPDFDYQAADAQVLAIHRHLPDREIYFLTNRRDRAETIQAAFRVQGLRPELWDPVTGDVRGVAAQESGGLSRITLTLPAYASTFVVFSHAAASARRPDTVIARQTLEGPWTVSFQPDRGAPEQPVQLAAGSWSDNSDDRIRYFSGTATYSKSFDLPKNGPGHRLMLDLGDAREVADVWLNGKWLGSRWTAPFRLDATAAAKAGSNRLTIKVANLWVNRLIGDAQPGTARKYSFMAIPTYGPGAPLRASGLLGPVTLESLAF